METLEDIKNNIQELIKKGKRGIGYRFDESVEGGLFHQILFYSYLHHGRYDYITIIKLYKLYGKDVFKMKITTCYGLYDSFDENGILREEYFERIQGQIDSDILNQK